MDIYSLQSLCDALNGGQKFDYVFFWGHRENEDGTIGASCCSQWFAAGFTINEVFYPSAEHFMMAEKARLFSDREALAQVMRAKSPNQAKAVGRKVRNFDAAKWSANCFEFVVSGNLAKFEQNPRLKSWLISTTPLILVEASPTDAIWGIGLHREDERAKDPLQWCGSNLLGFALMKVRDTLLTK